MKRRPTFWKRDARSREGEDSRNRGMIGVRRLLLNLLDHMFHICSHGFMTRIDDDTLSLHLEVSLSGVAPALLDGLADPDRSRRHAAVTDLARHLAQRLRCFDIQGEDAIMRPACQPSLFPRDIGLLG